MYHLQRPLWIFKKNTSFEIPLNSRIALNIAIGSIDCWSEHQLWRYMSMASTVIIILHSCSPSRAFWEVVWQLWRVRKERYVDILIARKQCAHCNIIVKTPCIRIHFTTLRYLTQTLIVTDWNQQGSADLNAIEFYSFLVAVNRLINDTWRANIWPLLVLQPSFPRKEWPAKLTSLLRQPHDFSETMNFFSCGLILATQTRTQGLHPKLFFVGSRRMHLRACVDWSLTGLR